MRNIITHQLSLNSVLIEDIQLNPRSHDPLIAFSVQDMDSILNYNYFGITSSEKRIFVCAPVRSKPQRTYDQAGWIPDPQGYFAPMFLADMASAPNRS
ncbi:MAG: hypothetical protein OXE59_01010 [Bacteroidetes bacterium]|nr:hypothetical protein [Bacteroidota bacterium]MCY4232315.1 hypothetical protein [Bacteroidota bacterium]